MKALVLIIMIFLKNVRLKMQILFLYNLSIRFLWIYDV